MKFIKKTDLSRLPLYTAIFFAAFMSFQCKSAPPKKETLKFKRYPIIENNIAFYIPEIWNKTNDIFFHFKMVGLAPNGLPAFIEYRGLDLETLGSSGKDLYATGWYEAIAKNYPEWKYEYKKKVESDPEGTYEFEGTYRVATDTYRRIGKLRFRGKHIHAIYYMALDQKFDEARALFNIIDSKIQYNIDQ